MFVFIASNKAYKLMQCNSPKQAPARTMEVEIISKECIKPSSPTPLQLKTHKLSLLDQILLPTSYTPIFLFYPVQQGLHGTDMISERSSMLKQSLSETLARFYPFAGTIKDKNTIDCNDEGAHYVVSRVNGSLNEYLNQPDLSLLNKFIPREFSWDEPGAGSPITLIQENRFHCGGIVIGVLVCHMVADAAAMIAFLKQWAATARNSSKEIVYPNIDAPSIFPQSDHESVKEASLMGLLLPFFKKEKAAARRFRFDASAIADIQAKSAGSNVENPTRVEAVSALISKCIMEIFKARSELHKQTLITHAVNMRRRAASPFPECTLGNLLWLATAVFPDAEKVNEADVVTCLREAIKEIDGDFVKNLQGEEGPVKLCEAMRQNRNKSAISEDMNHIGFTSWCNYGLYDVDFGWGKPTWVSVVGFAKVVSFFFNCVVLMDTPGKGIEAWTFLGENDMKLLGQDKELLAYASVDPSPLQVGV